MCCTAFSLMAQNPTPPTDLYIKLSDASGIESNAYVPEMNLFVADMVKELPEEFQDGKFKVFELGCYSIQEYTDGGYQEAVTRTIGKDPLKSAENALLIGKRCKDGLYTSFEAEFKFSDKIKQCLGAKNGSWKNDLNAFMVKTLNEQHKLNKFDASTTHIAIKESLKLLQAYIKTSLSDCSDYDDGVEATNIIAGNFSDNNGAERGFEEDKAFVIFFNSGYNYIKLKITEFGKGKVKFQNVTGGFEFEHKGYTLFYGSDSKEFWGFYNDEERTKEKDKSITYVGSNKFDESTYKGILNNPNITTIPLCSILEIAGGKKDNCNEAAFEVIETGKVNANQAAWIAYLNKFNLFDGNRKKFNALAERIGKMTDDYFKVFIAKKITTIYSTLVTTGGGICSENLDFPNFKIPTNQGCQNAIFDVIYEDADDPIAQLVKTCRENYTESNKLVEAKAKVDALLSLTTGPFVKTADRIKLFNLMSGEEICLVLSFLINNNAFLTNSDEYKMVWLLEGTKAEQVDNLLAYLNQKPCTFTTGLTSTGNNCAHSIIYYLVKHIDDATLGAIGGNNYTTLMKTFVKLIQERMQLPKAFPLLKDFENNQYERTIYFGKQGEHNAFVIPRVPPISLAYLTTIRSNKTSFESYVSQDFIKITTGDYIAAGLGIPLTSWKWEPSWAQMKVSTEKETYLKPFDLVSFNLCKDIPKVREFIDNNRSIEKLNQGEHFLVPAVFLKYASDKLMNQDLVKTAEIAFDVATLATGAGETALIIKGIGKMKNIVKAVELVNAGMNLSLNLAGDNLKGTPFEKVKTYTDYFMMASLVKNVAKGAGKFLATERKVASIEQALEEAAKLCGGNKGITGCDLLNMSDDQLIDLAANYHKTKAEAIAYKETSAYAELSSAAKKEYDEATEIIERDLRYTEKQLELVGKKGKYDGKLIAAHANDEVTYLLLNTGEDFTTLSAARNLPGVSNGNGKNIVGKWLRGTEGNAGLFPKSIADKLKGKNFKNFADFRANFWKEVAEDADLAGQFTPSNLTEMKKGNSPFTLASQQLGGQKRYVLHHKTPIHAGGEVFNMDNLYIVTPKYHKEILSPQYHYGYGY